MWAFVRTAYIEQWRGGWSARVVLSDDGVESSRFIDFAAQPTPDDVQAHCQSLVASLNADAALAETQRGFADNALSLKYQTKTDLAQRFREMYRAASRETAARMAYWLVERIVSGDFTDAQVRAAFGLTSAQYTTAKAKLQALYDQWAAIQNAAGE